MDFAEENKIPILPSITSTSVHNIESCIEAILHAKENIILLSINANILSTLLEKLSDTIVYYDILLEDQIVLCMSDNTSLGRETVFTGNELAMKYEVLSIPTLVLFKEGKLANTKIGLCSKSEIESMINS